MINITKNTYLARTLSAESRPCPADIDKRTHRRRRPAVRSLRLFRNRLYGNRPAIFSYRLRCTNVFSLESGKIKTIFIIGFVINYFCRRTLHVWVSHGILGRAVALGVSVVHRSAKGVFSACDVFTRVGTQCRLFAHATFARVSGTSGRAKTFVTDSGYLFAPAVFTTWIWRAFIRRPCKTSGDFVKILFVQCSKNLMVIMIETDNTITMLHS